MTALPLKRNFTDSYGVEITFFEWPVANPRAVVQIAHGVGEHSRRYDHLAAAFNRAGFSVYAADQRGHGETGFSMVNAGITKRQGNLGPGGMKATVEGVRHLSELINGENPEVPLVLFGHSGGSMIAQHIFNDYSHEYEGLILSGSTLLIPGVLKTAGFNKKFEGEAAAKGEPMAAGSEWLSRDLTVGKQFKADPANFEDDAAKAFGIWNVLQVFTYPSKSIDHHVPILLVAGSDDPLGGERGNLLLANAYRKMGVENLEVIIYDGARHEVVNEINKEDVIDDLVAWVATHAALPEEG